MRAVDINCDLGEGCDNDAELMHFISSANIACGYHAGDRETMKRTVELAMVNGVAIGAHPGYLDRDNFGRTTMSLSSHELIDLVTEQLHAMRAVCDSMGAKLYHVKPHGAMYNQAAKDREMAASIAEAVRAFDRELVLYGLSGSFLISEAETAGLKTASEVFADRTYQADGTLTPRSQPGALIADVQQAIDQVMQMVETQTVIAMTGEIVPIRAETICIHGDGEHAVEFARAIHEALTRFESRL